MADETPENGTPDVPTNQAEGAEKTVPYERFKKALTERDTLREEVARWKAQAEAHAEAVSLKDNLSATVEKLKAEGKAREEFWTQRVSLMESGIVDPDGQDVARLLYGKLPVDGRPQTIGEWISGLKAEGATVPKPLAPYLVTEAPKGQPMPKVAGGTKPPPATPAVSPEQIRAIREKAVRTGDWSEWEQIKPALGIKPLGR